MFVYFANNLLLQRLWPSRLTGVISDFAWLFFAPIVVHYLFEMILPFGYPRRERIDLAIWGGIGVVFVAVKISPVANRVVTDTISGLLGIPVMIVVDPADTLAVISLIASFRFFRSFRLPSTRSSPSRVLIAVSVAALLTLADMAAEDYGIVCLEVDGNKVIASSVYMSYVSRDGGETWQGYNADETCWQEPLSEGASVQIGDGNLRVQFGPGQPVLISTDGGSQWHIEYELKPSTEVQRAYYQKYREGNPMFREGPLNAVIDPSTGNVVFAMGHEGVLLRKPDRSWEWVTVGPYTRVDYLNPDLYLLLWGEGVLAIANGLLIVAMLGRKVMREKQAWKRIGRLVFLAMSWVLLEASMFIFPPALSSGDGSILSSVIVIVVTIMLAVLAIPVIIHLGQSGNVKRKVMLPYVVAVIVLFFLPYLLWFGNVLSNYYMASGLAFVLQIVLTMWSYGKLETA